MGFVFPNEQKSVLEGLIRVLVDPESVKDSLIEMRALLDDNQKGLDALQKAQVAYDKREAEVKAQEAAMSKKSQELEILSAEIKSKEAKVNALIADYTARVAKLKSIIG